MTDRAKRLAKLLDVQRRMTALHETRHAGFLAASRAAADEAAELASRFDQDASFAALFPEIYHRRIGAAVLKQEANAAMAAKEAGRVATAQLREGVVERAWREALRLAETVAPYRDLYPQVVVRPLIVVDYTVATLASLSRSEELLVVGRRAERKYPVLHPISVSHRVIHHASCPVAVVPIPVDAAAG